MNSMIKNLKESPKSKTKLPKLVFLKIISKALLGTLNPTIIVKKNKTHKYVFMGTEAV